jgi:hypothetical protein
MPKSKENRKYKACKAAGGQIRYTRISQTEQMKICIRGGKSVGSGRVEKRKRKKKSKTRRK